MRKRVWDAYIGDDKIKGIECLDSGSQPIWFKFVPIDQSKPMEVGNVLVQPDKVNWDIKNSHFETIDREGRSNYYEANSAGSLRLDAGTTSILKAVNSKIVVFPLDNRGSLSVYNYTLEGSQFEIVTNKPMWIAYLVSGSGSVNPI